MNTWKAQEQMAYKNHPTTKGHKGSKKMNHRG
jgi:hypothetical protein